MAWLIDVIIRLAILMLAGLGLLMLGRPGKGVMAILFFALEWLYPVFFEVLGRGATPGKRALDLVVLNDDGSPIGWGPSLTRNLLRVADFLPFFYLLGLVSMLWTHEFRRVGDIVAGTLVTYRREKPNALQLPEAPAWRPRAMLGRSSQRAVLVFAERAPRLSSERAEELAELVPQLTGDAQGALAVQRLYGLARVLAGHSE